MAGHSPRSDAETFRAGEGGVSGPRQQRRVRVYASDQLTVLIYELLDAHRDTTELAMAHGLRGLWLPHVDYLRALQRTSRELLARATGGEDV